MSVQLSMQSGHEIMRKVTLNNSNQLQAFCAGCRKAVPGIEILIIPHNNNYCLSFTFMETTDFLHDIDSIGWFTAFES